MKTYRFYYHFNKPAYKRTGKVQWTVHWRGKCITVDHINCHVPTFSKSRKTQPVAVIEGKAESLTVIGSAVFIQ